VTDDGDRFRILSVDGGGIRGLIPAIVLADLEARVSREAAQKRSLSDCFHLVAGTSTGGLIALGLTAPDPSGERARLDAADLVRFYREQGPSTFRAGLRGLLTLGGWLGPKYSPATLERVLRETLGEVRLRDARRDLVVTSYDMKRREPHFFKRWRAAESEDRNPSMVDAALATAAAPTYFPSHGLEDRALVDGGVFGSNPTVAAIAEALKRTTRWRPTGRIVMVGRDLHLRKYMEPIARPHISQARRRAPARAQRHHDPLRGSRGAGDRDRRASAPTVSPSCKPAPSRSRRRGYRRSISTERHARAARVVPRMTGCTRRILGARLD
jgi:predicted acylesterase/phospholipase RssA